MTTLRQILSLRRALEYRLRDTVNRLLPRSTNLSTCAKRDQNSKFSNKQRYELAKKQYVALLDECATLLNEMRAKLDETEAKFEHADKFKRRDEDDAKRRKDWDDRNSDSEET